MGIKPCYPHVRAYMPSDRLRRTKFFCFRCDKLVDPQCEAWTTREYLSPKLFFNKVTRYNYLRSHVAKQ